MSKKAILVNVEFTLRVVVDQDIDPNVDPEFEKAVKDRLLFRIKEEGTKFISEHIEDFYDDLKNPYNPEFDD